jgi:hypothetical protein
MSEFPPGLQIDSEDSSLEIGDVMDIVANLPNDDENKTIDNLHKLFLFAKQGFLHYFISFNIFFCFLDSENPGLIVDSGILPYLINTLTTSKNTYVLVFLKIFFYFILFFFNFIIFLSLNVYQFLHLLQLMKVNADLILFLILVFLYYYHF